MESVCKRERERVKGEVGGKDVVKRERGTSLLNSTNTYSKHEFHCAIRAVSGLWSEGRAGTNRFQVPQCVPPGWHRLGRLSR